MKLTEMYFNENTLGKTKEKAVLPTKVTCGNNVKCYNALTF